MATYNVNNPGEINAFNIDLQTRLRNFKREFGVEFLERVRQRTPVRTGDLQNGWGFDMKQESINVWNTQDYAAHVEQGTEKMAPRRMLAVTVLEREQIAEVAKEKAGLK
jgi:hypothetical protein